jgi:hypothetical protein
VGDAEVDRGLRYLKGPLPKGDDGQLSAPGRKDFQTPDGTRARPATELLSRLI